MRNPFLTKKAQGWTGAAIAVTVVAAMAPAANGAARGGPEVLVDNLNGPRGVAMGPLGRVAYTKANGTFWHVVRKGPDQGELVRLGKVPRQYIAPAISMNRKGQAMVLTAGHGEPGAGMLFRWHPTTGKERLANIGAYQKNDPDPYDLEGKPTTSNPFGVVALGGGGALVADAEGNDLLRVLPGGKIHTVARVKPRKVRVPKGLGKHAPPAGTVMKSEAVITSVAVGSDGFYYIGELRGFPAPEGKSQIWRINPKAKNALCNPAKPNKGPCKRYADGFTSIVDIDGAADGSLWIIELSKKGWLKMELGRKNSEIGSLYQLKAKGETPVEHMAGELVMPGGVEAGRGHIYVTNPVFGKGQLTKVR